MNIIQGLSDVSPQQLPVILPDGSTMTLTVTFRPEQGTIQGGWFYDVSWDGQTPPWQNLGRCLVAGPNVLRQYKNQIPFGLTVSTKDGQDPKTLEDFSNGNCTLLLLDQVDVINIEETYFPGN